MKLNQELIDEIRSEASITEVIGHYLPLVKKGRSYTAVCPFHDDHDPSLSISEDKQIYKCFVCGNGGNVFTFVMNYKKLSFPESVAEVAKIIGKQIDIDLAPKEKKVLPNQRLYDAHKETAAFCNYLLSSKGGSAARAYLEKRGLSEEIISTFEIGYDPSGSVLYKFLHSKGYSDQEVIEANLGRLGANGMYDVFGERVLFPIQDPEGNYVAFTARDISGRDVSKYINTAETKIYTKGNVLYNYHRARPAVRDSGRVIVCEGVMDVIAFARAGISYAVATLGTACSRRQLELLKELSNNLLLAYDGDDAGQNAILKLGTMALQEGMNITVLNNETGLDPDEIVTVYEGKGLSDLVGQAIPFMDFVLRYYQKHLNLDNYNDRKEMTIRVGALIDLLRDDYDKTNYSEELYRITRLHKLQTATASHREPRDPRVPLPQFSLDGLTKAEYTILVSMAENRRGAELYKQELGTLLNENCARLAVMILEDYRRYGSCSFARLYDQCEDPVLKELITDLSGNPTLPQEYDEMILEGSLLKVREEMKRRKLAVLQEKLKKIEVLDPTEAERILKEYADISKEIGGSNEYKKEKQ